MRMSMMAEESILKEGIPMKHYYSTRKKYQ